MATEHMECPQCGEDAVNTPPTDPVPWAAHSIEQPQWSHKDGSSLCPVLGGSGGYVPAQPRPKTTARQPDPDVSRLDPPERLRPEGWARPQDELDGPITETGPERLEIGATGEGDTLSVTTHGPNTSISEPTTGKAGAWATQAVLDAINSGRLRAELLEDCEFWAAKAAEQRTQAEAETDPGTPERQLEDWSIRHDHVDGLTADYDLDREA
jgi:hypothetical protein